MSFQQYAQRVISGEARGSRAVMLRAVFGVISPVYSTIMRLRNWKFDRGIGVRRLSRPVLSIGNITAGGTGKTPVVQWLCQRLREGGERPAVLMRGYKAKPGERGDEQAMLEGLLNLQGVQPIVIHAEADRFAGGLAVLKEDPAVNLLVMDDGFQHRRLARDFDLVLVDAIEPLGFGRVFPRGLLRELPGGLRRADAILITHADQVADVQRVVELVRRFNSSTPIFRCAHTHVALRSADGGSHLLSELSGKALFAFAGIGNPEGFGRQLQAMPGRLAGTRWFGDHWCYTREDLDQLMHEAKQCGAEVVVTTEKDWVKVGPLLTDAAPLPICRVDLALKFDEDHEAQLLEMVRSVLAQPHLQRAVEIKV